MSEYSLPNLFRSYLWKWRRRVSCKAGGSGRRKGRGKSGGRHRKVAGSQGLGRQVAYNKAEGWRHAARPPRHNFLETPRPPGVSQPYGIASDKLTTRRMHKNPYPRMPCTLNCDSVEGRSVTSVEWHQATVYRSNWWSGPL